MSPCRSRTPQSVCGHEQVHTKAGTSRSVCGHGYVCAAAGIPLQGLWPKDKSTLEKEHLEASVSVDQSMMQQVHLEASVAVHEVMLEHLKACGHG